MLLPNLLTVLILALLIAFLSVAARRLKLASPILMLMAGALLAFVPKAPAVAIDPEIVLLLLLPPLLYTSGVRMSWRGFRSNLRPILLLAIGCVLFTAAIVAMAVHFALGVSWPVGFVLGAIVSPPDAVAPMAVLSRLRLPRRLITILEGESLVNDATALVALSFALVAVGSSSFSLSAAVMKFVIIAATEVSFGLMIGYVMLRLRRAVADARAEVLLALATPFIAFWPPHVAGGSGVIACVSAGLYVSGHGRNLIRPATRLQGYFIWDLIVWAVEALVFLLAGLQARTVLSTLTNDGWERALTAGILTSVVVIVVRFLWVYPATYLPRMLIPAIRRADPAPGWRMPFLVSVCGLRGTVSLAAALLIQPMINGAPFPDRDLVLFATYSVIVVTLVGLGGALPAVVRAMGLDRMGRDEAQRDKGDERRVRIEALDAVLKVIPTEAESVRGANLRGRHQDRRNFYEHAGTPDLAAISPDSIPDMVLLRVERETIERAYCENRLTDEARQRIERELDLEDARIRHAIQSAGGSDTGVAYSTASSDRHGFRVR